MGSKLYFLGWGGGFLNLQCEKLHSLSCCYCINLKGFKFELFMYLRNFVCICVLYLYFQTHTYTHKSMHEYVCHFFNIYICAYIRWWSVLRQFIGFCTLSSIMYMMLECAYPFLSLLSAFLELRFHSWKFCTPGNSGFQGYRI